MQISGFKLSEEDMEAYKTWEEAYAMFKDQNKDYLRNKGSHDTLILFLMKNKRL